jgi:hypothetical protein
MDESVCDSDDNETSERQSCRNSVQKIGQPKQNEDSPNIPSSSDRHERPDRNRIQCGGASVLVYFERFLHLPESKRFRNRSKSHKTP